MTGSIPGAGDCRVSGLPLGGDYIGGDYRGGDNQAHVVTTYCRILFL